MIPHKTFAAAGLLAAVLMAAAPGAAAPAPPPAPAAASSALRSEAASSSALRSEAASSSALRSDQADALLKMLADAPSHGFAADEFPTDDLRAGVRSGDASTLGRLRSRAVAYARAQHGGRLRPDEYDHMWGMRPQPYDAAADLDQAVRSDRVVAWIASQPPPFARYRVLRDGLAVYVKLAAQGGWKPVPAGPELTMGETGPRVRALRARLGFEDGLLAKTPLDAPFDEGLKASLAHFQDRHGLLNDGVTGARTIAALNVSPRTRAEQIRANMERWRWLPRDWPVDRLEVNIAAATLDAFQDGKPVDHMLAASGRPTDQTPMLTSTIRSIVLNPPWHVPNSIADKELLPKGRAYLVSHGFTILPPGQGVKLIQKAGPTAALGQVKFDFPNTYGVYLHDTPSRAAFGHASRSVSHGCVRLQRPFALAKRLLASNPDWPADKVDEVLASQETTRAPLATPMAVMLMYWTAFPDGAQLAFRDDVYGWDAKLVGLLAADRPA